MSVASFCSALLFANSVFLSSHTGWIIRSGHGKALRIRKLMAFSASSATGEENALKNLTRKKKSANSGT